MLSFRTGAPAGLLGAALAAALGSALSVPSPASAAELTATPASLGGAFSSAAAGDTIRLASGDYGTFSGGAKAGTVTLAPQPGATATLKVNLNGAQNVRFDGLTIDGATVQGSSRNIAFVGSRFTGMSLVRVNAANAGIVFDHSTFDGIDACSTCYEGRITVNGTDQPSGAAGVVISNSHFSGGNADGVQLIGDADGVQVGPGNEFTGLKQASAIHTDPIQLYGARNTVITGNYIHDSSTGIMAPDGGDGAVTISNNVFARIVEQAAYLGHKPGVRLEHNTIAGSVTINDDPGKSGPSTSGVVVKNNVLTGSLTRLNLGGGAIAQEDYNLFSGGSGAHDIRAAARFTGGASPAAMDGFRLVAGSSGAGAADDGTDMGAFGFTVGGAAPAPAPPVTPPAPPPVTNAPPAAPPVSATPAVTLDQPLAGATFTDRLDLAATAADDSGVARVDFWVDGRRVASDDAAPYAATWTRVHRLRFSTHTVTARAFAQDGQVATQSVTVRRVRQSSSGRAAAAAAAAAKRAWRVTATPSRRGTVLTGIGTPKRRIVVKLARCRDRSARTVARVTVRTRPSGRIKTVTLHRKHLCTARLQR